MAVSFSYVFLPIIHAVVEPERARELLHRLFPRYYAVGLGCGLIAVASVSLPPETPHLPFDERLRLAVPVVVAILCTLTAYVIVFPRLAQLQRSETPQRYSRWHQLSAMLNTTVVATLLLVLAATVMR